MAIRKMGNWEFRKAPRFDEKSHPYIFAMNMYCLTDKEIWRSLVAVGKSTPPGPFQSLAKWLAPNFKIAYTDLKEVGGTRNPDEHIMSAKYFAIYFALKTVARKILTLAKYNEVH